MFDPAEKQRPKRHTDVLKEVSVQTAKHFSVLLWFIGQNFRNLESLTKGTIPIIVLK